MNLKIDKLLGRIRESDEGIGGVSLGETSGTAYRGDRGKTAYDHSQAAHAPSDATAAGATGDAHAATSHAPSNAQKNSDITKEEIEAKLTGELTSHSHASGGMENPMTIQGDIIYGGNNGTPTRLAKSTNGKVLKLVSGAPAWADESGGGGGLTVEEVTGNTTIADGKLYLANSSSNLNFTLPSTYAVGFTFGILAKGSGGWTLKSGAANQVIKGLSQSSVVAGASGARLQAQSVQYGYAEYVATTANTILTMVTDESSDFFPSDKGYVMGYDAQIESLDFVNENRSTVSATMSTLRAGGAGVNSQTKGYCMGGSGPSAVIDALLFSTEANGAIDATLPSATGETGCGVNSSTTGYIAGGTGSTAAIRKLIFATETTATNGESLSVGRVWLCGGMNSSTTGYMVGGTGGTNWTRIDVLNFATGATSTNETSLSIGRYMGTGYNSTTKGYIAGGAPDGSNRIDELTFSTSVCQSIGDILSIGRTTGAAGVNSQTKGYCMGGNATSIDVLNFATNATSLSSAELNYSHAYGFGFQSGGIL